MNTIRYVVTLAGVYIFSLPIIAFAIGATPPNPEILDVHPKDGPTTLQSWYELVQQVVGWLFVIAVILGVAMLIIAGIMYITSQGGPRATTARQMILYAVVGIAVAALAWAIVNLVSSFFTDKDVLSGADSHLQKTIATSNMHDGKEVSMR